MPRPELRHLGNVAANDTTGTQHVWHKDASAFSHCAAEVAVNGTCIALDSPGFVDAANGDYRPVFGSRLVDAGCEISLTPPASATDIAGLARVSGPAVDIGCHEFAQDGTPLLYDPSGAAITDAGVLGWLEGVGAGQSDISALTQRGFGDAYLLNIDITKTASGETGGRLAVAGIAVSGGKAVVEVALSRKEGGREVGVRRINGSLRLLGAASLDEAFEILDEADISNADFSGGNTASAEFDIGKNADSMFLSAAIE